MKNNGNNDFHFVKAIFVRFIGAEKLDSISVLTSSDTFSSRVLSTARFGVATFFSYRFEEQNIFRDPNRPLRNFLPVFRETGQTTVNAGKLSLTFSISAAVAFHNFSHRVQVATRSIFGALVRRNVMLMKRDINFNLQYFSRVDFENNLSFEVSKFSVILIIISHAK